MEASAVERPVCFIGALSFNSLYTRTSKSVNLNPLLDFFDAPNGGINIDNALVEASVVVFEAVDQKLLDGILVGRVAQFAFEVNGGKLLFLLVEPLANVFLRPFSTADGLKLLPIPCQIEIAFKKDLLGVIYKADNVIGEFRVQSFYLFVNPPFVCFQKKVLVFQQIAIA
jgi:hypothetical protein